MPLNKDTVIQKMRERNFTVYATMGNSKEGTNKIHFVSAHMYDFSYNDRVRPRDRVPVINVIVDLEKDEFECIYNVPGSINMLNTPTCGSVMNDEHFDRIVCKFESQAKWMSRLTA
jgi:hypothetical protein